MITNVAGSASRTQKHDGDNTTKCFKIIFVNDIWVQTGERV